MFFSLLETESQALIDMRIDFRGVDDDEWLNKWTNSTMLLQPLDGAQQVGYYSVYTPQPEPCQLLFVHNASEEYFFSTLST